MKIIAALSIMALAGCTTPTSTTSLPTQAQVQTAVADVQAACGVAETALGVAQATLKGGALQTVNSVGAYITASCSTADAIATLAANPTSVAWLNTLASTINTTAALVKPAT